LPVKIENTLVLEKNPPKQGLKHFYLCIRHLPNQVLEKNPPKQGLKHTYIVQGYDQRTRFREKSTKTRIETADQILTDFFLIDSFREKSTKTRIETIGLFNKFC